MKNLKSIKIIALAFCFLGIFSSCSEDDNTVSNTETVTFLYASNNSNGDITVYDVNNTSAVSSKTLVTTSTAADGVYYDQSTDAIIQASRSNFGLEGISNASLITDGSIVTTDLTGTQDMTSPRELAVNGNMYVVADNADVDGNTNTPDGRLFVYIRNGNSFTLRNIITTTFKLWGITFNGSDLYAVVDTTNELAVFSNFLANTSNATLNASKRIAVEGIVRTHGLTYDASSDIMILTDIASAMNGQDDGGFHVIENFTTKFSTVSNGGTLALSDQVRVAGSSTLLGNPVDVAYDNVTATIFIAEAGNGGGRILAFNNFNTGGNITPSINLSLASASSVYISRN